MSIDASAAKLHELFRRRELSPVEHAKKQIDAIGRLNGPINSFVATNAELTLASARASEDRYTRGEPLGPLDGVPVTVKDSFNVAGWPTRRGSKTTSHEVVGKDAVPIARLREAGAVFLGKTTAPEFNWKGLTESPLTGVTRSPLDSSRHAGGSSGGAASATALGLGAVGVGSDAAGSVRIPAAFCGIVGYKPTFGTIPLDPYASAFWQLPNTGPITRTVEDAALAAEIMSGPASSDWSSLGQTRLVDRRGSIAAAAGVRIGVPAGISDLLRPEVAKAWEEAVSAIASEFVIETVDVPFIETRDIVGTFYRLGCLHGVSQMPPDKIGLLHDDLLTFVEPVRNIEASDIIMLQRRREELASSMAILLVDTVDVLLSPTMPDLPPVVGSAEAANPQWFDWCPFTPLFNLSRGPALSLPWSSEASPLPISLQIGGAPGRDGSVIAVASIIESLKRRCRSSGK